MKMLSGNSNFIYKIGEMVKHLRYDYYGAYLSGENRHAQEVMKSLGISYQHCTPQSIADQFWFWNCADIPENLPGYITDLKIDDPMEYVGWGLSKEKALEIKTFDANKIDFMRTNG